MDDLSVDLGKRIRRFRRAQKLKLSDLAQRTNINEKYLSRIELGKINTSIANLDTIASSLGVPLPILLDCRNSLNRNNMLKSLREKSALLPDETLLSLLKIVSELSSSEGSDSVE